MKTVAFLFTILVVSLISCNQGKAKAVRSHSTNDTTASGNQETIKMVQVNSTSNTKAQGLINIQGGGQDTDTCVVVDSALEKDPYYNKLLSNYLCHYAAGEGDSFPAAGLNALLQRPSFRKMLLLINDPQWSEKGKVYRPDSELMDDMGSEMLYHMQTCCVESLYSIANDLLKENSFDGVTALWEKADIDKLPSFNQYLSNIDTTNFYIYGDMIAVFHNSGNYNMRNHFMAKAATLTEF